MSNAQDDSERYGVLEEIFKGNDTIKTIQELFAIEMSKRMDKEILKQIEDDKNSVES